VPPPAAPAPMVSLMERYRGTEYDSGATTAPAQVAHHPSGPTAKVRLMLLGGVLALVALYGGMLAWTAAGGGMAPSAARAGAAVTR